MTVQLGELSFGKIESRKLGYLSNQGRSNLYRHGSIRTASATPFRHRIPIVVVDAWLFRDTFVARENGSVQNGCADQEASDEPFDCRAKRSRRAGLISLPDLMQRVQTRSRVTLPFTRARTR